MNNMYMCMGNDKLLLLALLMMKGKRELSQEVLNFWNI